MVTLESQQHKEYVEQFVVSLSLCFLVSRLQKNVINLAAIPIWGVGCYVNINKNRMQKCINLINIILIKKDN